MCAVGVGRGAHAGARAVVRRVPAELSVSCASICRSRRTSCPTVSVLLLGSSCRRVRGVRTEGEEPRCV
eukprot:5959965-Prymnesium_polylepis.2